MKFTVDKHERYVVIEPLTDFLDGEAAAKLKGEFMLRHTGGQRNIVLNLCHVGDADEDGLRMGLLARRLCKASGGLFILTGLNQKLKELLRVTNLEGYFKIAPSISKAEDMIFGNEIRLDLRGEQAQ
ncbi:anti-anti-sigma factor [Sphingobacterium allocomposti]|jgi:anti-sigma B factor antagonist|uniref:Anti-anti-sigma factor n=1 Tax=Sphingobacterium allocomposti TaxID=415956 RepID=A0A5S5DSY3_9SPHI|nr:STAS domain-containing protein [Sphingobacterium composti Yoo et al. 2007 non Ten et al. 2007]TYP98488.1 anti-anti-sigma factor [Sphingobacterium composti Yoo et al. 2007 non Ten et al. 2007]HLS95515.1 STAS domain-containing protein [Sphingobacterium sp.]